jgi:membrane protein implicated in regulation of membrane protease activity
MEYIQMLDGLSPWWWVIIALALGSIEMATMTFFLIWLGLAALCMAGIMVLVPDMSGAMQITLFSVLSIVLTFVGRYLLNKFGDGAGDGGEHLNKRSAYLVGRPAMVLEFDGGKGVVEVEGMRWRAQWAENQTSTVGEAVRITRADAMVLFVEKAS